MKQRKYKLFGIIVTILVLLWILLLTFTKPLVIGTVAKSQDNRSAVVEVINNNRILDIKITEIEINDNLKPELLKIQIDDNNKGFVVSDSFTEEGYHFEDIQNVKIDTSTNYGISIKHKNPIKSVTIFYRYLGIELSKKVDID